MLTIGLVFGLTNVVNAQQTQILVRASVPELDPALVGGGIVLLAGGLLVLNERRSKNK
jgi:hypothetical protein